MKKTIRKSKSKRKRNERIALPGGCSMSTPSIYPANWEKDSASTSFDWYIKYRFYDPTRKPDGKQRLFKGMNSYRVLAERQAATQQLLKDEIALLKAGYNPIIGQYINPTDLGDLQERTPLKQALQYAFAQCDCDPDTKAQIKYMLNYVTQAMELLGFGSMPIFDVRQKHIRKILEKCSAITTRFDETKKREVPVIWSNDKFNKFRTYLMILFKVILGVDAIEANPCKDIEKKVTVQRIRETLTRDQRVKIDKYLHEKFYTFWRFLHIFFHSGAREKEIIKVQGKHVNLEKQTFIRLVKKGKQYKEKPTTIKDIALPFWQEVMKDCGPEDYVFSAGLQPGPRAIRADQINKRWYRLVKKPHKNSPLYGENITADFYSLKYSNTTETVRIAGDQVAANQNAHTSTAMVVKIYDVERGSREHEQMKQVNNPFV